MFTHTRPQRGPTRAPTATPRQGHTYIPRTHCATMMARAGAQNSQPLWWHKHAALRSCRLGSQLPTSTGPAFPGASPCLKHAHVRSRACRPTSGRYASRTLAARAHSATMVAHAHVQAAGRSTMVVQAVRHRSAYPNPHRKMLSLPPAELALSPRAWRGGSHGVCRNSGLAALLGVGVGAPQWWRGPTAATMVARPRSLQRAPQRH